MTVDDNGKVDFGYKALGKLFIAMMVATTIPTTTAMIVMYGDKRVVEEKVGALERTSDRHDGQINKLDSRVTTIEAKQAIEE